MKKTNVFGAVLCSAALACGMAMPAFAAAGDGVASTETNDITATKGGTTLVQAYKPGATIVDKTVSATVPLKVGIYLNSASGVGTFDGPSADKYVITNTGTALIKVSGAAASVANNSWTIDSTTVTTPETALTDKTKKVVQVSVNDVKLNVKPSSFGSKATTIAANGGTYNLTLSGWTNMHAETYGALKADTADDMVKIVYTIEEVKAS